MGDTAYTTPIEPTLGDYTDLTIAVDIGGPMMEDTIPEREKAKGPWQQASLNWMERCSLQLQSMSQKR
jgi:hypothetical protein